jgi:hypothetical protein
MIVDSNFRESVAFVGTHSDRSRLVQLRSATILHTERAWRRWRTCVAPPDLEDLAW